MATTFIGTNGDDTIVPGFVSPGVEPVGPDSAPGDGDDTIISRSGNDIVAGGRGADVAILGAGDDTFGWAPADGSDTVFGQSGRDRLVFDGDGSDEAFTLDRTPAGLALDRDVGAVTMTLSGIEVIDILAGDGNDEVSVGNLAGSGLEELSIDLSAARGDSGGDGAFDRVTLLAGSGAVAVNLFGSGGDVFISGLPVFTTVANADTSDVVAVRTGGGDDAIGASGLTGAPRLELDGRGGDDTISGGDGADRLRGGGGDDLVSGGRGDDEARLGAGFDGFFWVEGDGSDTVHGGAGTDFLSFISSGAAEAVALTAAGAGTLLTRDVGAITMTLTNLESVSIFAAGGEDTVTVGDLAGTAVASVDISLSTAGQSGDGAADTVRVEGGAASEVIDVESGGGTLVNVRGIGADIDIVGVESGDTLVVTGGGGVDDMSAINVDAGQVKVVLDGGDGGDFLFGSAGDDLLLGGEGDDRIAAGAGNDEVIGDNGDEIAILGGGDDRFFWDPGEGNDAVVGDAGIDTLDFDGSDTGESIDIAADGLNAVLLRDVGAVRMDLETMERIDLRLFAGTDEVNVGELTGTTLEEIVIDLGGADGASDLIVIDGTDAADDVTIGFEGDAVVVSGLSAVIRILNADALDNLQFDGLGGDDRVDASALGGIELTVRGGDGDDVLIGSAFDDRFSGDAGDDVILTGEGRDTLFGGDGEDVLDGGPGFDQIVRDADDVVLNGEIVIEAGFLV
jgi:Ca2+-binding RTX toxin-like protein